MRRPAVLTGVLAMPREGNAVVDARTERVWRAGVAVDGLVTDLADPAVALEDLAVAELLCLHAALLGSAPGECRPRNLGDPLRVASAVLASFGRDLLQRRSGLDVVRIGRTPAPGLLALTRSAVTGEPARLALVAAERVKREVLFALRADPFAVNDLPSQSRLDGAVHSVSVVVLAAEPVTVDQCFTAIDGAAAATTLGLSRRVSVALPPLIVGRTPPSPSPRNACGLVAPLDQARASGHVVTPCRSSWVWAWGGAASRRGGSCRRVGGGPCCASGLPAGRRSAGTPAGPAVPTSTRSRGFR